MVNDDIVGVAVAIDVMRHIQQWSSRHYTYRLIILPETIGSVTYLSHNEHLVPNMIGGLFLEMVGLDQPHALQLSFTGQTEIDRCFTRVFQEAAPDGWIGAFRTVIGNDERQFNAPGMRVPMLSLSRVRPKTHNHHPYPQYHSNQDSPEITHSDSLIETRDLTLRLIEALEGNQLPVNNFRGEVFMSGVGMHIDYYTNPEGNKHLFNIMYLIDGTRTIAQIAEECNISFQSTRQVIDKLAEYNLVTYRRPILKRHAE
jgi:aminopeptidase-like protein